jgi:hypothetical protein
VNQNDLRKQGLILMNVSIQDDLKNLEGLFRTSRAREALLENVPLRKQPDRSIQQEPLLFMVEFSRGSAEEPSNRGKII